jgi:hydroxyethylthiazole kinase-like uncharacterized protein yjeF
LAERIRGALVERTGNVSLADQRILLLVGTGDNGGDTLLAGAQLARAGATVHIVPTGNRMHTDGLANAQAAGAMTHNLNQADATELRFLASSADVIVDGILGTGTSASPALRGGARYVVDTIVGALPDSGRPLTVAVDIPSGIGPDDGSVPDPVVLPADITVTFGGIKAGLLREPASQLTGRIELVDIGITTELRLVTPAVTLPG